MSVAFYYISLFHVIPFKVIVSFHLLLARSGIKSMLMLSMLHFPCLSRVRNGKRSRRQQLRSLVRPSKNPDILWVVWDFFNFDAEHIIVQKYERDFFLHVLELFLSWNWWAKHCWSGHWVIPFIYIIKNIRILYKNVAF